MRILLLWNTFLSLLATLSGLFLVGFMSVHFLGVSLINFGDDALNWYTAHLDKSNIFIVLAVLAVILVFLVHMINGFRVMWRYFRHLPEVHTYVGNMKYKDSFLWYIHFLTGILLAIFVTVHLTIACFAGSHTVTTVNIIREQLADPRYLTVMGILLAVLITHGVCGIRNIIIKYNLFEKYRTIIFYGLAFLGLGLFALGLNNLYLLQ